MTIYLRADGSFSSYPTDKRTAKIQRIEKYDDGNVCPDCGECSIRYVRTDKCAHCARLDALNYFNSNHEDYRTAYEAAENGAELYITTEPCERSGHLGIRRTDDNRCAFCAREIDARKARHEARMEAKERGEMFYTPPEPCPECGTSKRRVNNHSCRQCEINARKRPADIAGHEIMKTAPDTIISRSEAVALGFKVYRTGNPCGKNHTGWRYVSTGNCIECRRRG